MQILQVLSIKKTADTTTWELECQIDHERTCFRNNSRQFRQQFTFARGVIVELGENVRDKGH